MEDRRMMDLKEQVLARVRKVADPGLHALVASGAAASTGPQLAAFAQRAFSSAIPRVIEELKAKMAPAILRIDGEIERKERERTLLTRNSSD